MVTSGRSKGFVLVDVILGLFILTTAIIAVASIFFMSSKSYRAADNSTVAYEWAQQRLEFLKSDTSWRGSVSPVVNPSVPNDPGNSNPPRTGFKRSTMVNVANLPSNTFPPSASAVNVPISTINNHLLDVTVTVSWPENGSTRTISLRTLIERYP